MISACDHAGDSIGCANAVTLALISSFVQVRVAGPLNSLSRAAIVAGDQLLYRTVIQSNAAWMFVLVCSATPVSRQMSNAAHRSEEEYVRKAR